MSTLFENKINENINKNANGASAEFQQQLKDLLAEKALDDTKAADKQLKDEIMTADNLEQKLEAGLTGEHITNVLTKIAPEFEASSYREVYSKRGKALTFVVQAALTGMNIGVGNEQVDGKYGADTRTAVATFQAWQGLTVDGFAGKDTIAKMVEVGITTPFPTDGLTEEQQSSFDARKNKTAKPQVAAYAATGTTGGSGVDAAAVVGGVSGAVEGGVDTTKKLEFTDKDKEWVKNTFGKEMSEIPTWKEGYTGVAIYRHDDFIYVGEIKGGKFDGKGLTRYESGSKYIGEYKNHKMHGKGIYFYANGDKYVGDFKNDKADGKGTYSYVDGTKYIGEYKNDVREGKGDYYYADGDIGKNGTYKDGKYIEGTETLISKTPEKSFPVEQLNEVNMKNIWDTYIAPEYTTKWEKEWLKKKGADTGAKVSVNNGYSSIKGMHSAPLAYIDNKKVGDGQKIDLVKFVAAVKGEIQKKMEADRKQEESATDKKLLGEYLEDKIFLFDKIFTDADREDPIRLKQIQKLQTYFSPQNELPIDDTEIVFRNGKKYIQLDLDNYQDDRSWTKEILIPYEVAFPPNGGFTSGTFQKTLRKYIVDELFSKKDRTDLFTKIRDQNIELDL